MPSTYPTGAMAHRTLNRLVRGSCYAVSLWNDSRFADKIVRRAVGLAAGREDTRFAPPLPNESLREPQPQEAV